MPNRILRDGILTSPRVTRLGWPEEVFYRRLMSVVDDFGRYYADLGMLRAACYPRQLSKVSDPDIGKWLTALVEAALVSLYPAQDGERYIQLHNFGQQVRAKKSKFPDPLSECVADAKQMLANAHLDVDVDVDVDDSPRKRVQPPDGVALDVWKDFLKIRRAKRAPVTETAMSAIRREAVKAGMSLEQALRTCCERGWQGFRADWLTTRPGQAPQSLTVPGNPGPDPALEKLKADSLKAAPMPANVREAIGALKGKVFP